MKVTLITPHIGRKRADEYVQTWQMEPLPMATLAGITPDWVDVTLFDERVEPIDFDDPTDLVGIAVETYTAKRAYEIAAEYRRRGVRTILGGYQVMLVTDEAQRYADSILVGYAEPLWARVLEDAARRRLQPRYVQDRRRPYEFGLTRRDIFAGRRYRSGHTAAQNGDGSGDSGKRLGDQERESAGVIRFRAEPDRLLPGRIRHTDEETPQCG